MRKSNELPTAFGRFIRETRERSNMSLDTLAVRMSSSKSYVWGLENGRHAPSLLTAGRLALVLATTLQNLYDLVKQDAAHYERAK